jgi:hypothetical protein
MNSYKFILCLLVILICKNLHADEAENSPLIIQQERIQQLIIKLDEKFLALSEILKTKEPENAKFLLLAFKKSKETLIQLKVDSSIKFLKDKDLEKSIDAQQKIIDDLFGILNSLTSLDYSNKDEIKRLENMVKNIEKLIKDEFRLISESDKIDNKEKSLEKYATEILKLEELIKESKITLNNTIENRVKGLSHLSGIAKSLEMQAQKVEKIFETIAGFPMESKKPEEEPSKEIPIIKENSEPKVETKSNEAGLDTLIKAFEQFGDAEKGIVDGKPFSSEKSQKDAIASLYQSLEKLQKEKERILSLPEDYSKELAKNQDKIKDDLEKIKNGTDKSNPNKEDASGDPSGAEPGKGENENKGAEGQAEGEKGDKPSDGESKDKKNAKDKNSFEKTKKYMEESSKNLKDKNISNAKNNQQKSIEELKKIRAEIEKSLAQLRKEEKEEKLANLENRFVEILNMERVINEQCLQLDMLKIKNEWTRNEKVKCINLMQEQISIKELVVRVEDILLEDASTIVFPDIVNQVKEDMMAVAGNFKNENTGKLNQILLSEIIQSLEELIESLQKAREEAKKEAQEDKDGKGQDGEKNQLISKSSELKLLKKLQLRVNRMTKLFAEELKNEELADSKKNTNRIFDKQKQVLEITKKINERKQ